MGNILHCAFGPPEANAPANGAAAVRAGSDSALRVDIESPRTLQSRLSTTLGFGHRVIDVAKFLQALDRVAAVVTASFLERVLKRHDSNGDGTLSREEMLAGLRAAGDVSFLRMNDAQLNQLCDTVFELLDADRSGSVSHSEIVEVLLGDDLLHQFQQALLERLRLNAVRPARCSMQCDTLRTMYVNSEGVMLHVIV
jgi:Ca2+-binding EF-hand superfamily protein